MTGQIRIGTSGWNYESWIGPFYPEGAAKDGMLPLYADTFDTAEISNTFYNLPEKDTVRRWRLQTPDDFLFAVKASRYLTHMKKLKDSGEGLAKFLEAISPLKYKQGPVLFQCPPKWKVNPDRLGTFLASLPDGYCYTFEFRDESWFTDEVYDLLRAYNAALCLYDIRHFQTPETVTADFVYIRLHGPQKEPYTGTYDGRTLSGWAKKIARWAKDENRDVFCYFDNDQEACAPQDALRLTEMLFPE